MAALLFLIISLATIANLPWQVKATSGSSSGCLGSSLASQLPSSSNGFLDDTGNSNLQSVNLAGYTKTSSSITIYCPVGYVTNDGSRSSSYVASCSSVTASLLTATRTLYYWSYSPSTSSDSVVTDSTYSASGTFTSGAPSCVVNYVFCDSHPEKAGPNLTALTYKFPRYYGAELTLWCDQNARVLQTNISTVSVTCNADSSGNAAWVASAYCSSGINLLPSVGFAAMLVILCLINKFMQ